MGWVLQEEEYTFQCNIGGEVHTSHRVDMRHIFIFYFLFFIVAILLLFYKLLVKSPNHATLDRNIYIFCRGGAGT
jgi:hypothetical protein